MTDPLRPVPRWLHLWAVVAVLATFVLLAIGQLVTSFAAGMADPVWPTEPWYVFHSASDAEKERFRKDYKFILEHSHRIAGWTVGGIVIVLAGGVLWTDPRKGARWVALAGLVVLVLGYGEFHGGLIRTQKDVPAANVRLPLRGVQVALAGLAVMLAAVASGAVVRTRGAGLRLLAALALVAVMIQGLLGGFRVKLNELAGTDLAAFHGIFAQVVFGLLAAVAVLSARPSVSRGASSRLAHSAAMLALVVFVQVAFGAMVRHYPVPLSQRLHFATAFLATALAVWVLRAVFADPAARARAGWIAPALAALLAVQLYLGIEAWLAKFGAYMLPELVPITPEGGAIRTLHALVGSGVWAVALALALRLRRTPTSHTNRLETDTPDWSEPRAGATLTSEVAATRLRGDAR